MKRAAALVLVGLGGCALGLLLAQASGQTAAGRQSAAVPAVIDAGRFASLQDAFDALPEGGGIVRIPPGNFAIKGPLLLARENIRIEGSGAATHVLNQNEQGEPALVLRPKTREQDVRARIWRVQVANLRLSGNPKSGDGIRAEAVNEILLDNVALDHHGGNGISLIDCYEDPRVADSIITYNGKTGLEILRGHDIVVNANQFEENQDAVRCIDSFNLCMNGNNVDDHLRHGVVIENTYGSVLSGNMIEECNGTAVILDRDCYGIAISANVIAHNTGGGVDLRDAWGCAVSANTFVLNGTASLVIGPASGRCSVTGNSFCNSHIGGSQRRLKEQDDARGVLLDGTADVTITGNSFSGLANPAVRTQGTCARIVFAANVVAEVPKEGGSALDFSNAPGTITGYNSPPESK